MKQSNNKLILPLTSLLLVSTANTAFCAEKPKRANIILFLVDDQGWYQSPLRIIPTMENSNSEFIDNMPNLMRLAQESSRFSQAYSGAPVSGPSRAGIQTGKTLCRLHYDDLANWVRPTNSNMLIAPTPDTCLSGDETTIAEILKQIDPNYRTAHFGKWHCDEPLINKKWTKGYQGYDYHDGEFGNGGPAYFDGENPKDIFGITKRAISFISEQVRDKKPFYLQVSHYAMHNPPIARPETLAKYKDKGLSMEEQKWAAVAEDLDVGFGLLWQCVKDLGIEDNTYIIWMSDNGIPKPSNARRTDIPLNGCKLTLWEGGIRVPLLIKGPGIEKGRIIETPVVGYDLLPTICDMAGGAKKLPDNIDGGSFFKVLKGESSEVQGRGKSMFFHYPYYRAKIQRPSSAIVKGNWKLIKNYENNSYLLFNLKDDILEQNNLADKNKAKYNELKSELDNYLAETKALMPKINPNYVGQQK